MTDTRIDDLARRVAQLEVQDARLSSLERRVAELEQRLGGRPSGTQRINLGGEHRERANRHFEA